MQDIAIDFLKGFQPLDQHTEQQPQIPDPLAPLSQADRELFRAFGWGRQDAPKHPTISAALLHQFTANSHEIAAEHGEYALRVRMH